MSNPASSSRKPSPPKRPRFKSSSRKLPPMRNQNDTNISALRFRNYADPMPPQLGCVMKWAELLTFQTAVGVQGQCGVENVFNMNGLYDPDLTGSGHQPYEFDQLASFYSRYCVVGFEYDFTLLPQSALPDCIGLATLVQGDVTFTGLLGLAMSDVIEKTSAAFLPVPTTGMPKRITGKVNLPALLGLSREEYFGQDRFNGGSGNNPSSPSYLRMAIANLTSTTTRTLAVMCRLQFQVIWFDRVINSASN